MTNSEFDERLEKIADLIEADRREWQQRMEASEGELKQWRQESEEAAKRHEVVMKRHDEILLVHAKLVMDNEREWKEQVADLWEVIKNHESRLAEDRDGLRTMLASMDRLVKTVDDFIKGLNRQNGQGQ